jgi:hypothetical protein
VVPTLTGVAADTEAGPALAGPANGKVIFCNLTAVFRIQIWIESESRRAKIDHRSKKNVEG